MNDKVQKAINVIERDYDAEVRQWADDFIKEIKEGEYEDRDTFFDRAHEQIDGAHRVIYTRQAQLGLLVSRNDDAGIDSLGVEGFDWSAGIPWSQLMYFAFEADIFEAMSDKGFDINDDEIFEEDEDE